MVKESIYTKFIKRLLDIILSLIAIVILSPVLIIVAIMVRIKLGSPVIFTQVRPGKDEKLFKMYKFRTMTSERDSSGNLLPDEIRLTPFGKKLRATSLDELPELFNILKGDMSIVGPRPQLVRDMMFMSKEQRMRHTIKPGLTGWAQVNGRNAISWEKKLSLDIEYLDNISLFNDIKVLILTIISVVKKEGISSCESETSLDFGDWKLINHKISEKEYLEKNEKARLIIEHYEKN